MAGPAIRSFEFATRLSDRWNVTVLALQPPEPEWSLAGIPVLVRDPLNWRGLAKLVAEFDVVITQPLRLQLLNELHKSQTPIVIDAYVPNILEQGAVHAHSGGVADIAAGHAMDRLRLELRAAARMGSAYLCAGESYRDFLLGVLATEGRLTRSALQEDPSATHLVVSAPYGLSLEDMPQADEAIGPLRSELNLKADDTIFIWAGGIWDWLDPFTPIRGFAEALSRTEPGDGLENAHIVFLGVDHPNPDVRTESLEKLESLVVELGMQGRVHVRRGWVQYNKRGEFIADADVGICAHQDSLETRYSWRQRLLDHVWASLPTICSNGDELGRVVATAGAGVQVAANDVHAWAEAMKAASDEKWRSDRKDATAVLRQQMSWEAVTDVVDGVLRRATSRTSSGLRSPRSLMPSYFLVQLSRLGLKRFLGKAVRSVFRRHR